MTVDSSFNVVAVEEDVLWARLVAVDFALWDVFEILDRVVRVRRGRKDTGARAAARAFMVLLIGGGVGAGSCIEAGRIGRSLEITQVVEGGRLSSTGEMGSSKRLRTRLR